MLENLRVFPDKRDAALYIIADGFAVNTRIRDKDVSGARELKRGLPFWTKTPTSERTAKESSRNNR